MHALVAPDSVRPATCLQQRQILAGLGKRPVANVHVAWRLYGPLDGIALDRTLESLVARHEALRTALHVHGDNVEQHVRSEVALPVEPLRHADDRRAIRRILRHSATEPFDVRIAPLARVALLRLSAEDHLLVWTLHHAISDAWSLRVLLDDSRRAYAAAVSGLQAEWPALPIQPGDYAAWERDHFDADAHAYWRTHVSDRPRELELPDTRTCVCAHRHIEETQALRPISPAVVGALAAAGREVSATLSMTLTAAFAALVAPCASRGSVAIGVTEANRDRGELRHVVGCCLDFIPLHLDVSADESFSAVVAQVRDQVRSGREHRLPICRIGDGDWPRSPTWFDILVNFTREDRSERGIAAPSAGLRIQHASGPSPHRYAARYNWSGWRALGPILHQDADGGVTGTLLYNRRLVSPALALELAGRFDRILRAVAARADRRLSSLAQDLRFAASDH
jgi:hypothetical protein